MEQATIPGRCMSVSVSRGDNVTPISSLHEYGLSIQQVQLVGYKMSFIGSFVKAPLECRIAALVGDCNIRAEGEKSFKIGHDLAGRIVDRGYSSPLFCGRLLSLRIGL